MATGQIDKGPHCDFTYYRIPASGSLTLSFDADYQGIFFVNGYSALRGGIYFALTDSTGIYITDVRTVSGLTYTRSGRTITLTNSSNINGSLMIMSYNPTKLATFVSFT